jgi:hypothetical protein
MVLQHSTQPVDTRVPIDNRYRSGNPGIDIRTYPGGNAGGLPIDEDTPCKPSIVATDRVWHEDTENTLTPEQWAEAQAFWAVELSKQHIAPDAIIGLRDNVLEDSQ